MDNKELIINIEKEEIKLMNRLKEIENELKKIREDKKALLEKVKGE